MLNDYFSFFKNQTSLDNEKLDYNLIAVKFRELRNLCALNGLKFQTEIAVFPDFIETCFALFDRLLQSNDIKNETLKFGIQFIGNFIVGNIQNKVLIYSKHLEIIRNCVLMENPSIRNYSEMIIYNLMLDIEDVEKYLLQDYHLLDQIITDAEENLEFAFFLVEKLINFGHFLKLYQINSSRRKLYKIVSKIIEENFYKLDRITLQFLINKVEKDLENIEIIMDDSSNDGLVDLLHVICNISCSSCYKILLKGFAHSLIDSISYALCSIHKLGLKDENHIFTPCTEIKEIGSEELPYHPMYRIKGLLIRIIGNLSFQNSSIQNRVRENRCIGVILDCCKYDAKNPYIMEWSILAISSLCNKNIENQRIIKNLPDITVQSSKISKKRLEILQNVEDSIICDTIYE